MSIPLKVLASNDSFAVLQALPDVLDGKSALFVRPNLDDESFGEVDARIALIVESSGSTGTPKRIHISRDALLASARASIERLGAPGQWLLALPAHYIAGMQVLVRSILSDRQPVLMNPSVSFTAEGFVRSASLMQGTHRYSSLVPAQLELLATAINNDPSVLVALRSFDRILVGGQATNPATLQRLLELGVNLTITYGMTETCGGCVYDGVPLTGVDIDIDEAGQIRHRRSGILRRARTTPDCWSRRSRYQFRRHQTLARSSRAVGAAAARNHVGRGGSHHSSTIRRDLRLLVYLCRRVNNQQRRCRLGTWAGCQAGRLEASLEHSSFEQRQAGPARNR
jgi:acyl-CoA synthetase (AMP-forming)/AMP-acid ligase II